MINYYVIQVNTGWFEVRRDYGNGLNSPEVIDAFDDEADAFNFMAWLENKDANLLGFYP